MSFTDLYFDREEKRISNYARELIKDELESREILTLCKNLKIF